MHAVRRLSLSLPSLGLLALLAAAAEQPSASGLAPGQRPGPYSSLVSFGPQRGKSHCFICETEDRPAVIVFARGLSDPLGKLVRRLDKALEEHKAAELRAWVTFLHDDQAAFDPQVVDWARKQSVRNVPLSVFEDPDGPPSYKLSRDAEVTVLLSVKQKVVRTFAFKSGELTEERVAEVAKALAGIATREKK
jgi:hypothetical protein